MYKVRPLQDKVVIKSLPTCMYKTKPFFNEDNLNFGSNLVEPLANLSLVELEELSKQQGKQLRRLERLLTKSNEFCEDLRLDNLVIHTSQNSQHKLEEAYKKQEALFQKIENLTQKVNKVVQEMNLNSVTESLANVNLRQNETRKQRQRYNVDLSLFKEIKRANIKVLTDRNVEDLVFYVNPNNIPLDLLNFFDVLSQETKSFIKFYVHSSISSDIQQNYELENKLLSIGELFEGLSLSVNDSRVSYDFGFTFIWRKMESNEQELKFSNGTIVSGEAKIAQSINELLPQQISEVRLKQNKASSPLIKILKTL
ncbi:unnamed protein product [Brachionus calyciflorus]|uniref:AIMP2 thioredoxin-like domain-containing protein n=1 Tax=Brachionus calyciflorus TaxID=104777 RepID=A0A814I3R6_9BILA|nr:unnamed protein product [Brachionus calyciflorus]